MNNEFKVRGTIMSYGGNDIVIVHEETSERPVMLEVYRQMLEYINDQSCSDMEEKYMPLDFVYTSWCHLMVIMVPSKNEYRPAKVICQNGLEPVKIFGEQKIIDEINPEPMSWEDWEAAVEFAEKNCYVDLRRVRHQ